ncbi:DUF4392 domain-containing protein [Alkaliphilus pronyensis]|uniref:DUF4392 domain-containing protein n=1 Tax=Alkaliphilus pronyensis TaxID=1482732 RepID=A0A6I0F7A1_9FIRM|nr:DUF4392 domain-containing protein [Alkaliphilus pronyensis]KAB3532758.1 DUF4392 domain-containing protein [Alkaliphilus pronyensis]
MKDEYLKEIEAIVGLDIGNRGLSEMLQYGDLQSAVDELYNSKRVIIITGFCIKDTMTGETDGPIGAVSLANCLMQIGKEVLVVTDEYSKGLVAGCCKGLNINLEIEVVPFNNTDDYCRGIINGFNPTHIVAIERPGRASDGRCYSMRGEDITGFVPNTDTFFHLALELGITRIAIGDGGNEMGMGKIATQLKENISNGHDICAITSTDYLIVAGVSNWGGHGLGAGLSIMSEEMLLHEATEEIAMLKGMVSAGGVDGCSKKNEMTVDGLSLEINLHMFEKIRNVVVNALQREKKEIC